MSAIRTVTIRNIKGETETLRLEHCYAETYMICRDTAAALGAGGMKVQGKDAALSALSLGLQRMVAMGATIISEV